MNLIQILLIGSGVVCFLMFVALVVLFFVSRRSQKVMESLLQIMTRPERAKVQDAVRVLNTILADEIQKMESSFQTMRNTLNAQIVSANELRQQLEEQNNNLVLLADDATKKLASMSGRLDNTVEGLRAIVESNGWQDVETSTDKFSNTINELLTRIDKTSQDATDKIAHIRDHIDAWIESGKTLSDGLRTEFENNNQQNQELTNGVQALQSALSELAQNTTTEFNNVKVAATDYETVMSHNNDLIDKYLNKLDTFGKQSKKQLTSQVNTLTITSNTVGGQVRLAESSIDKQIRKLSDVVEKLMSTAGTTETSVRGISSELATLTNRFNDEIKEFATGVVSEIKTVSGVANATLENTKSAAGAFSESVKAMATGVRETLIKMNTAHAQLSGQSANLIKMSEDTTAQLQPLSVLIEKYFAALPDLSRDSVAASDNLNKIVAGLNDKINAMKTTVSESTDTVTQSAIKLEELASQSRQQMIDLMSDYAKAVNTMQTLNKQMMVARATAPMEAIKNTPKENVGRISSDDFLKQSERMFEKMHEQSLDLIRAAGADIPDVVWKKYHDGDKTIFSKWLAKMLGAADKKRVRDMMKSDAVFRSQATQFVRSFDKILTSAKSADNSDKMSATLIKTDLGQVYITLKTHVA